MYKLENLGRNLREIRRARGISMIEVGEACEGRIKETVASWELGRAYPNIQSLVTMANLYDCCIDDFFKDNERN